MPDPISVLREKGDRFVGTGFRDEEGVWHESPHSYEFNWALTQVEALRDAAWLLWSYYLMPLPDDKKAQVVAALDPFAEEGADE